MFHTIDSHGGSAGKEGSHSTEALQQWDRHVQWSFPFLSRAQHPGSAHHDHTGFNASNWVLGSFLLVQTFFLWSLQQCMQDLMDGYFPSELQERFPDGVPFEVCFCLCPSQRVLVNKLLKMVFMRFFFLQVHDKRDEEFIFRLSWEKFPGEGQAVRGEKDTSGLSCKYH